MWGDYSEAGRSQMDMRDFKIDTRYTLTLRDAMGRVTPCTIYVYRVYGAFMIARSAGGNALLRKIAYPDVVRIVSATPSLRPSATWSPLRCSRRKPGATGT